MEPGETSSWTPIKISGSRVRAVDSDTSDDDVSLDDCMSLNYQNGERPRKCGKFDKNEWPEHECCENLADGTYQERRKYHMADDVEVKIGNTWRNRHRRFANCIRDFTASRLLRPYGHNMVS